MTGVRVILGIEMSKTETQQVETRYGSLNVETIECDSCGDTMLKEDANRFTIGGREGFACHYCVREGPISFPGRVRDYALPRDENGIFWSYIMAAPVFCPLTVFDALFSDDEFDTGYFIAIVSVIVWVGVSLLVFYLL